MVDIKYVNYDYDNKDDFDFRMIIQEEVSSFNVENQKEVYESRENAFDGYRDRYIIVIQDDTVIGYLIYGNDRLFKSSIIKRYYFHEGYEADIHIKRVILEFMSRGDNSSVCLLQEAENDTLIQLGFKQSGLRYGDSLYVYFYDERMNNIHDILPMIKQKSEENIGSYYFRKMNIIQKLHFSLLMISLFSGMFIFAGVVYLLETIFTTEPLTALGIILVAFDVIIFAISTPIFFRLKSSARDKLNYYLKASGLRVKLDYNRMFF